MSIWPNGIEPCLPRGSGFVEGSILAGQSRVDCGVREYRSAQEVLDTIPDMTGDAST
jgi:hypothetical protein